MKDKKQKTSWELRIEKLKKEELIWTLAYPPQSYRCRYIDLNKSKPYINSVGGMENRLGLPYWIKAERHIANQDDFIDLVGKLDTDQFTLSCKHCGLVLAKFLIEKNTKGSEDGILKLEYTQHLLAYRPREDGLLGFECICGFGDTRLGSQEKLRYPLNFPKHARSSGYNEAKFNNVTSHFLAKK